MKNGPANVYSRPTGTEGPDADDAPDAPAADIPRQLRREWRKQPLDTGVIHLPDACNVVDKASWF